MSMQEQPLITMVYLMTRPRELSLDNIRACVERVLGARCELGNPEATEFVLALPAEVGMQFFKQVGQSFMVKVQQGVFLINSFHGPYAAASPPQLHPFMKQAISQHQGWFSVDWLPGPDEMNMKEAAYRTIGKLMASFAGEDCQLVLCPELEQGNLLSAEVLSRLAGDTPLSAFEILPAPSITRVAENDPRLLAATAEARRRWPEFAAAFAAPAPNQGDFMVKAKFTDGVHVEHQWAEVTQLNADTVTGILDKTPLEVTGLHCGDTVTIALGDIEDWLYLENDVPVGGFSVKVLREIM